MNSVESAAEAPNVWKSGSLFPIINIPTNLEYRMPWLPHILTARETTEFFFVQIFLSFVFIYDLKNYTEYDLREKVVVIC